MLRLRESGEPQSSQGLQVGETGLIERPFLLALPQPRVTYLVTLLSCCFTQRQLTHPQIGLKGQDLRPLWSSSQTFLGDPIKPPPPS